MRILHYCARVRLEDGGVVRAVLDLTSALTGSGKDVLLMATDGQDLPAGSDGPQTLLTGSFDRPPNRFSSARLQTLEDHIAKADVLHLHTPWEVANTQLAAIARRCGTPYIVSLHGMLDDWCMRQKRLKKRAYLLLAGRRMLHGAAAVHCTAEAEARQARRWIRRAQLRVVPLVFEPSSYLYPPPSADPSKHWPALCGDTPVILFLSRLHFKKGVDRLIDAAAKVAGNRPIRLVIAGSGEEQYEQALRQHTESLDLNNVVEFVGFVQGDRKIALYRTADLFVLPTSQENFGLALPEAMGSGLPAITTKGVDIWPELEDSGGAIIAEKDSGSIAAAIESLLDDDERIAAMGAAGRDWVEATFAGDAVVNRFIDLYRQAMHHERST